MTNTIWPLDEITRALWNSLSTEPCVECRELYVDAPTDCACEDHAAAHEALSQFSAWSDLRRQDGSVFQ